MHKSYHSCLSEPVLENLASKIRAHSHQERVYGSAKFQELVEGLVGR